MHEATSTDTFVPLVCSLQKSVSVKNHKFRCTAVMIILNYKEMHFHLVAKTPENKSVNNASFAPSQCNY